ncbi:MAG TPA: phage holin family protein [Pseudolabrys sp.]|nr:phage holin family protein [Pseudolabrys sp.]
MLEGWLRHAELTAKSKGFIPALAVWGIAAGLAALGALIFLSVAGYVWLSRQYDNLIAALILTGIYVFLAVVFLVVLALVRRHTMQQARLELADRAKHPALWQDPRVLAAGVQVGRMIGWKKTLPLAAIGLLAAGIAREWSSHEDGSGKD